MNKNGNQAVSTRGKELVQPEREGKMRKGKEKWEEGRKNKGREGKMGKGKGKWGKGWKEGEREGKMEKGEEKWGKGWKNGEKWKEKRRKGRKGVEGEGKNEEKKGKLWRMLQSTGWTKLWGQFEQDLCETHPSKGLWGPGDANLLSQEGGTLPCRSSCAV